jgi:hypothetical protein
MAGLGGGCVLMSSIVNSIRVQKEKKIQEHKNNKSKTLTHQWKEVQESL